MCSSSRGEVKASETSDGPEVGQSVLNFIASLACVLDTTGLRRGIPRLSWLSPFLEESKTLPEPFHALNTLLLPNLPAPQPSLENDLQRRKPAGSGLADRMGLSVEECSTKRSQLLSSRWYCCYPLGSSISL